MQEQEQNSISVFPNPFNDKVEIDNVLANTRLVIYASNGQILRQEMLAPGKNELDLSQLASGLYIFQFVLKEEIITKKLVK